MWTRTIARSCLTGLGDKVIIELYPTDRISYADALSSGGYMTDTCDNCGAGITAGSAFKMPNTRELPENVAWINFVSKTSYTELCAKCANDPANKAYSIIDKEIEKNTKFTNDHITDFPMLTVDRLPKETNVIYKGMITSNITVGTGIFSEFSQGFSDFFGSVNINSGMSYKINKGETSARLVLVMKAISMGANCVIGVDVDYGTTANNSAVINMQGTAVTISNMDTMLATEELVKARALNDAFARITQLRKWRQGDITA